MENFPLPAMVRLAETGITTLEFESTRPTVVKSLKQRDLLNTWLWHYARAQATPRLAECEPARLGEEMPPDRIESVGAIGFS